MSNPFVDRSGLKIPTTSVREGPGSVRITAGDIAVASLATNEGARMVPAGLRNAFAAAGAAEENLLVIHYPLVHEGPNLNGDVFLAEEMKASFGTLIGTPLDKDHSQGIDDIVGRHFNAVYEEVSGKGVILCDAYVYAGLYPDIAFKLSDGVVNGVSMETQFAWSERSADQRTLHGLNFIGAGLVRIPADPQARVSVSTAIRPEKVEAMALAIARAIKEHLR